METDKPTFSLCKHNGTALMSGLVEMRSSQIRKDWFVDSDSFASYVIWFNVICDKCIRAQIKVKGSEEETGGRAVGSRD